MLSNRLEKDIDRSHYKHYQQTLIYKYYTTSNDIYNVFYAK